MRASWRDPDDLTPGARRTPKEITGFRTFCPLRRMSGHPNSGITAQHIMAADLLRERVDLASKGFTADRPLIYVAQQPLPRFGMSRAAVAQMRAYRSVRRAIALFTNDQLFIVEAVLLRNMTLRAMCQGFDPPASQPAAKRHLLVILDALVDHFEQDVQDDLARGRRLPA